MMVPRAVTDAIPIARYTQAFGVKPEDLRSWRPIVSNIFPVVSQDQQQQAKRNAFRCFGPSHLFGSPFLAWVRRIVCQAGQRRVFGKRIAFENYHTFEVCIGLPVGRGRT